LKKLQIFYIIYIESEGKKRSESSALVRPITRGRAPERAGKNLKKNKKSAIIYIESEREVSSQKEN